MLTCWQRESFPLRAGNYRAWWSLRHIAAFHRSQSSLFTTPTEWMTSVSDTAEQDAKQKNECKQNIFLAWFRCADWINKTKREHPRQARYEHEKVRKSFSEIKWETHKFSLGNFSRISLRIAKVCDNSRALFTHVFPRATNDVSSLKLYFRFIAFSHHRRPSNIDKMTNCFK